MAQAQVYSVNIVGYVNKAATSGALHLVENPLVSTNDTLNSVLAGSPATSQAWVWNGAGYTPSSVGAKSGVWSPDVAIPTGTGFFYKPAGNITNTFVGEVIVGPGQSATNSLSAGVLDLTGALIPVATTSIATDASYGLTTAPATSQLWKWNGVGYTPTSVGAKSGVWSPDVSVSVGEAVFIKAPSSFDWVQTLPAN
jgi:hypothetical protein